MSKTKQASSQNITSNLVMHLGPAWCLSDNQLVLSVASKIVFQGLVTDLPRTLMAKDRVLKKKLSFREF